jgi:hypothetical protein
MRQPVRKMDTLIRPVLRTAGVCTGGCHRFLDYRGIRYGRLNRYLDREENLVRQYTDWHDIRDITDEYQYLPGFSLIMNPEMFRNQ